MVKVEIKREDDVIKHLKIKGHSNFNEYGDDIVCASISSISITTINALIKNDPESVKYIENEGLIDLTILKTSDFTELLLNNMIDLLKELEKQYKNNIKIK